MSSLKECVSLGGTNPMVRSVKAGAVVSGRCFCRYCRQLRHSINHAVFNCQALIFAENELH